MSSHWRSSRRWLLAVTAGVALAAPAGVTAMSVLAPAAGASTITTTDVKVGETAYAIPTNTISLSVTVIGAGGSTVQTGGTPPGPPGQGADLTATIPIGAIPSSVLSESTPTLYLEVGSPNGTGGGGGSSYSANGGGESAIQISSGSAGYTSDPSTDSRLIVAGGGGGGGEDSSPTSGGTGGAGGNAGQDTFSPPGNGGAGTQSGNGAAGGSGGFQTTSSGAQTSSGGSGSSACGGSGGGSTSWVGGAGEGPSSTSNGGGGGGGFVGGGGGGAGDCPYGSGNGAGGGGGAGSSFVHAICSQNSQPCIALTGDGSTAAAAEVVVTANIGTPPTINSPSSGTLTAGSSSTLSVTTAAGANPSCVNMSETGAPSGVVFSTTSCSGTATIGLSSTGPPAGGVYTFSIIASNGMKPNAVQTFTLTVDQAPVVTSASSTSFQVNQAGSFTVNTSGFPKPSLTVTGSLPPGLSFTDNGNGTGTIVGTPDSTDEGPYSFTITASNNVGSNQQDFTLFVDVPVSITSAATTTFTVGQAGSFQVAMVGYPPPTVSVTSGSLPSSVTLDGSSGVLSGTPTSGEGGTYPVTLHAANSAGSTYDQDFNLVVDEAPNLPSTGSATFVAGTSNTYTIVPAGGYPNGSSMTLTAGGLTAGTPANLPSGVVFQGNPDGTATISGKPPLGSSGEYKFVVDASNGISPDASETFTLIVDQGPAITSLATTAFTDGSTGGPFDVTASGFSATNPMTLSASNWSSTAYGSSQPPWLTFTDNGGGNGVIATSGAIPAGVEGKYTFTITASNGVGAPATQSFTLNVVAPPAFTSGSSTTFTAGTSGTFIISTTGYPAPTLTEVGPLPSGVTFTDNGNGTATLAGAPGTGSGGVYPLTIVADNGVPGGTTQSFTLTVDEALFFKSAGGATFQTGVNGPAFTVQVGGYPLPTISETGALPSGVTLTDNHDGTATLTGVPAAGTDGAHAVTLNATNGATSASQPFTVTVDDAPKITSTASATFAVGSPGSFTVQTTGFPAVSIGDGGAALPSGVTFKDNGDGTATLSGTPAAGQGGVYPITITATNGVSPNATQHFNLLVVQDLAFTSAPGTTFTVGHPGSFTISLTGSPVPAISDGGAALPKGVTFVDNKNGTATLRGTPAALAGGVFKFTVTASNGGVTPTVSQPFTLTVLEAPIFTSPPTVTLFLGQPSTFTVSAAAYPGGGAVSISDGNAALPPGITYRDNHNGTGTLSGTPSLSSPVDFPVTLTATNGIQPPATQHLLVVVGNRPGYALASADGGAFAFGGTKYVGSLPGYGVKVDDVVGVQETLDGRGYWMATATGAVYALGDAKYEGSITKPLNRPIVGIVATADDRGYWLVATDGGLFAFGDARFVGSVPALGVSTNQIIGMTPTRDGKGYYCASSTGVVYGFGDAIFHGGAVKTHFGTPVVSIVLDRATEGYWITSSGGGVFGFDAGYYGSVNNDPYPIVGVAPSADYKGYFLVDRNGRVFALGDAKSAGGLAGRASVPIIGISAP